MIHNYTGVTQAFRYLAELQEGLSLPEAVAAFANPKSSTGRIDVFTRLGQQHLG